MWALGGAPFMVDVKRSKKVNHGKTLDRLNARITNSKTTGSERRC